MTVHRLLLYQRPVFRLPSSCLNGPGRFHSSSAKQTDYDEANISKSADKLPCTVLEATAVQNKVGKSWKYVSGLFTKLKEAFVSPPVGNQHGVGKFGSKVEHSETKSKASYSKTITDLKNHMEAVDSSVIVDHSKTEEYPKLKSQVQPPFAADSDAYIKAKHFRAEVSEDGELYGLRTLSKDLEKLNSESKSDSESETSGASGASDVGGSKLSMIETLCKQIKNAKQSEEKSEGYPHGLLFGAKDNPLVGGTKRNVLGLIDSMSNVPIPREHQILRLPTASSVHEEKKKLRNGVSTKALSGLLGVKENASSKKESVSGVEIHVGRYPAVSDSNSRADNLLSQTGEEGTKGVSFSMMSDDVQGPSRGISCSIPGIIGDPNVPFALVKHPTRTIKISNLSCGLMLDKLEEALEIGAGNVSVISLGPASSVAYAEFKTEEAKEGAIAKQWINIEGKMVKMYRIDIPRTTVVRMCVDRDKKIPATLHQVCKEHGEVSKVVQRAAHVVDVYFELEEWPNMLNILNSLNGMEVCGQRVVALPAPVYPKEILEQLWKQQEGRKHVKSVARSLVQRINSTGYTELLNKAYEYYIAY